MSRLSPSMRKLRAGIVATGFAAAVFTGAAYGAGLKTQQEWDEKRTEFRDSTPEQKIAALETQREQLVMQRDEMRQKIRQFEARVKERDAKRAAEEARKAEDGARG